MKSQTSAAPTSGPRSHRNHLSRLAAVALAAALGLLGVGVAASPAHAEYDTRCSSRDWRCDPSGYAERSHRSFWMMVPGHNCTNYVAWRLIREGVDRKIDYLHNGGDWADDARSHNITVNHKAVVGAVAQWEPGAGGLSSAGHVAYVETVGDGWIDVAEDNYPSGPMNIRRVKAQSSEWPSNFIHFPRPAPPEPPTPTLGPTAVPPGWNIINLFRATALNLTRP